jgi:hypothetical protein
MAELANELDNLYREIVSLTSLSIAYVNKGKGDREKIARAKQIAESVKGVAAITKLGGNCPLGTHWDEVLGRCVGYPNPNGGSVLSDPMQGNPNNPNSPNTTPVGG